MKSACCCSALVATLVVLGASTTFPAGANAQDRCVAYGDPKTDFTWRLCPAGEKYERQYLYFGVWTNFYSVKSHTGKCDWVVAQSSWRCPDRTIRCDASRCGAS
jgi:hypothetical protein